MAATGVFPPVEIRVVFLSSSIAAPGIFLARARSRFLASCSADISVNAIESVITAEIECGYVRQLTQLGLGHEILGLFPLTFAALFRLALSHASGTRPSYPPGCVA